MKTKQILLEISGNGGFCNLNNWNKKQIAEWVYNTYNCTMYVAKNVAFHLYN